MNKIIKVVSLICLIFLVITISGCVNHFSNLSPAPGCNQMPGVAGGCFSKFAIINEKIEPPIPCLKFSSNNCNSPYLSVNSSCEELIYINGIKIPREECKVRGGSYWIMRNNGKYEIISQSELLPIDLFSLPKEKFLSKYEESCIKEYEKIPLDLKLGKKEYDVQFNGDEYTKYGSGFKGVTSHTVVGSPGNCLSYTLRNFYSANCKIMEISTSCGENIELLNQIIEPDKYCKINDSYTLIDTENIPFYKGKQVYEGEQIPPLENKDFVVDGKIGNKEFKISFTVTKKLCD